MILNKINDLLNTAFFIISNISFGSIILNDCVKTKYSDIMNIPIEFNYDQLRLLIKE